MNSVSMPGVVFLVYREALGPIFWSVYVNPAARLTKLGLQVEIAAVTSAGEFVRPSLRRRWSAFRRRIKSSVGAGITRIPALPNRARNLAADQVSVLIWWLLRSFRKNHGILHCGASRAAVLALRLRRFDRRIRVVYHCWGPEAEEFLETRPGAAGSGAEKEAAALESLQRRAFVESDRVVCISEPMVRWATDRFGVNRRRIVKLPCAVDVPLFSSEATNRDRIRARLGLEDKFVVAYCGSMIPWQLPEFAIELLVGIAEAREDFHFLGLTMHRESLVKLLKKFGLPKERATILSVPHWEVAGLLASSDLGIIGRGLGTGPSLVHEISSPIKFGEYLACGTPVLMGEGVGDFSQMVADSEIGVLLPHYADVRSSVLQVTSFVDAYRSKMADIRGRCKRMAESHLGLDEQATRLSMMYEELASELR